MFLVLIADVCVCLVAASHVRGKTMWKKLNRYFFYALAILNGLMLFGVRL